MLLKPLGLCRAVETLLLETGFKSNMGGTDIAEMASYVSCFAGHIIILVFLLLFRWAYDNYGGHWSCLSLALVWLVSLIVVTFSKTDPVPWHFKNQWLNCLFSTGQMNFMVSHIFREGNTCACCLVFVVFLIRYPLVGGSSMAQHFFFRIFGGVLQMMDRYIEALT